LFPNQRRRFGAAPSWINEDGNVDEDESDEGSGDESDTGNIEHGDDDSDDGEDDFEGDDMDEGGDEQYEDEEVRRVL
jgi:hypothetical protein